MPVRLLVLPPAIVLETEDIIVLNRGSFDNDSMDSLA